MIDFFCDQLRIIKWRNSLSKDSNLHCRHQMKVSGIGNSLISKHEAPHFFTSPHATLHADDVDDFIKELSAVLADHGDDRFVNNCRFLRPDGDYVWLRIRGISVRNEAGEVTRIAGSMINISIRKNLEEEQREERHGMTTLIENIPVNVYFKDLESKFVMTNSATARRFNLEHPEELEGKCDHDFFESSIADKFRAEELAIINGGDPVKNSMKRENTEEGSQERWSVVSRMPWTDTKGNIKGIVGISSDVTSLVNTQNQLVNMTYKLTNQKEEMEQELQLAYEVQLAMIQKDQIESFPSTDDSIESAHKVNFAYRYTPVSSMAGDFYHVVRIDEKRMLRGLMEKDQKSAGEPEKYLKGVNDGLVSILKRAGVTMFATAFYGVIDLEKETFSFANAGHPFPIVISQSEVKSLSVVSQKVGPALGLVPNSPYQADSIDFHEFSKLVLFTDGLNEAENAQGDEMGMQRICDAISPEASIEKTLEDMVDAVKLFAKDNEFNDDVCLLGIKLEKS